MSTGYELEIKKAADKFLNKQPQHVQDRIKESLRGLLQSPPAGDIGRMEPKQPKRFRLRIGTYRAIFTVDTDEKVIYVETIDNRGDIY